MEDKKPVKISFSVFLLLIILVLIIIFSIIVCMLYNDNLNLRKQLSSLENTSDISTDDTFDDTSDYQSKYTSSENGTEEVLPGSGYGEYISSFIKWIWQGPEVYGDCIAEFDNVKKADPVYLASCAAAQVQSRYSDDIYGAQATFEEFNEAVVNLFGKEADGLITKKDLEKVFYVEKNPDGKSYSFFGFDGSEQSATCYVLRNMERNGYTFYAYQYEFKIKDDELVFDLEEGEATTKHIYDMKNNEIVNFQVKWIQEGNTYHSEIYDEDGKEIEDLETYLLRNYRDKLSLRKIELAYDTDEYQFHMVRNKLVK